MQYLHEFDEQNQKDIKKTLLLVSELAELNPDIKGRIWCSVFVTLIIKGLHKGGASQEEFDDLLEQMREEFKNLGESCVAKDFVRS